MSKVKINEDFCIGCGACESICPNVFRLENGKAKVIAEECKDCNCQEVAESCPVNAILVEE
ncbi:ferredoxin [bacterium]|nr:ferredoxin [bacterium]